MKPREIINNIAKDAGYKVHRLYQIFTTPPFDMYNYQTFDILSIILKPDSNCIDVGANKGDILKKLIKCSPNGRHFAFEPIPKLYQHLTKAYGRKATISDYAISDVNSSSNFHYFHDRPAVSGFKNRNFDNTYIQSTIEVQTRSLDSLIPGNLSIDLIKIDVEGSEYLVLVGSKDLIRRCKPFILFEFGYGGADYYDTTPEMIFDFITEMGMELNLLSYFLMKREGLSKTEFCGQYYKGYNYMFIAYDPNKYQKE